MKNLLIYVTIAMGLILNGCTHRFNGEMEGSPLANFEALWQVIDEKYCYLDEKGIDWDSVYMAYYPRFDSLEIVEYQDQLIVFDLMEEMLNLLCDGHVNLYSPFDISTCSAWYDGYPTNFDAEILTQYYLKDYRRANGLKYCRIDNDSIGYVYYGSFSDGFTLTNWMAVLQYFSACKGIVLDIRQNGGGSMENAYKLAVPFFSSDTVVGYWQHKSGPGHTDFSEQEAMQIEDTRAWWKRPVIVLCNRHSYSAANFFVSMMRYADNCLIIGGKSGGGGGMPMNYELPNGWMVRFSSIRMWDRDMKSIEDGVTPHLVVNQQSTDQDDLIEEAIRQIHSAYK